MARAGVLVDVAAGVPRVWPGETAVICASGPSLTAADVEYCRGKARTIAINTTLLLMPWADAFHACDLRVYRWHAAAVRAFQGLKFTMERDPADDFGGAVLLRNGGIWGLSTEDPTVIRNGRNSGYQAINIAYFLGCSRVILLGFDMQKGPDGVTHWHGDHPNRGEVQYRSCAAAFRTLVGPLAAAGVDVVNCSRVSAIDCFRRAPLEAEL